MDIVRKGRAVLTRTFAASPSMYRWDGNGLGWVLWPEPFEPVQHEMRFAFQLARGHVLQIRLVNDQLVTIRRKAA